MVLPTGYMGDRVARDTGRSLPHRRTAGKFLFSVRAGHRGLPSPAQPIESPGLTLIGFIPRLVAGRDGLRPAGAVSAILDDGSRIRRSGFLAVSCGNRQDRRGREDEIGMGLAPGQGCLKVRRFRSTIFSFIGHICFSYGSKTHQSAPDFTAAIDNANAAPSSWYAGRARPGLVRQRWVGFPSRGMAMKNPEKRTIRLIKRVLFLACALPALRLAVSAYVGTLGADPVATLTRTSGIWTLNLLFASLAISPLRKLTGWNWIVQLRRTLGLFAFFYACSHLAVYLVFDHYFDWDEIFKDVAKRPYITAGFTAFLMLIPLAATSTDAMMRRLGGKRWQQLHRLVYPIAIAGVLHYFWLVKRDVTAPGLYAIVLCVFFCLRLVMRPRQRAPRTAAPQMAGAAPLGPGVEVDPRRTRK